MSGSNGQKDGLVCLKDFVEQFTILDKRWQDILVSRSGLNNNSDHGSASTDGDTVARPGKKARHTMKSRTINIAIPEDSADPFRCSDLAVNSVYEKVEDSILPHFVKAWQDLDERKISASFVGGPLREDDEGGEKNNDDDDDDTTVVAGSSSKKKQLLKKPPWYNKHVRFPENFDYKNEQSDPPPAAPASTLERTDDGVEDRVVSLIDPTQTTSYAHELWNLFDEIPTSTEIRESLDDGMALPHTQAWHDEFVNPNDAKKKSKSNSRPWTHWNCGLYGIRMADRHGFPMPIPTRGDESQPYQSDLTGTIVLEFWKQPFQGQQQPPATDSSRMVIEFLGTQTLLDVHQTIVEMAQDNIWGNHVMKNLENDSDPNTTQTNGEVSESRQAGTDSYERNQQGDCDEDSNPGFFFVEDAFYTSGENSERVYVEPIQNWIFAGTKEQQGEKALRLGLTLPASAAETRSQFDKFQVLKMSEVLLETVVFGFGKRYVHVHHGNVECSMFLVDFSCRRHHHVSPAPTYPLIHDLWASPPAPDCEACQRRSATLVTQNTCTFAGGQRLLCQVCAQELSIPREELQQYSVWKQNMSK